MNVRARIDMIDRILVLQIVDVRSIDHDHEIDHCDVVHSRSTSLPLFGKSDKEV
jgi:hypothetical protein